MTCDRCGLEYGIGYSPWCKDQHAAIRAGRGPDVTYPGGLVLHNLGHEPVTVYSDSERKRIAKARGLVEKVQHVEGSPHTTDWSGPSPHTLATLGDWIAARGGGQGRRVVDGPAEASWRAAPRMPITIPAED